MTEKSKMTAHVVAHWKFDSRYFKEGSLAEKIWYCRIFPAMEIICV